MENFGLGRLPAADERDNNFLLKQLLPQKASSRTSRYWNASGWWGNQGLTPQCVGYSWAHWIEDGPITQPGKAPIMPPDQIYHDAQKIDEWPGERYDGTSVRAGAKVLQVEGFIQEYRWAYDVNTIIQAILEMGPVVVGTNWYYNMSFPNSEGLIKVGGWLAGGHAYVLNGVNTKKQLFRIKNSWGREWGEKGYAYISFDDMARLIKEDGEACLAVENKKLTKSSSTQTKAKKQVILSAENQQVIKEADAIRKLLK